MVPKNDPFRIWDAQHYQLQTRSFPGKVDSHHRHLRLPHSCQDLLKFLHLCREIRRTFELRHLRSLKSGPTFGFVGQVEPPKVAICYTPENELNVPRKGASLKGNETSTPTNNFQGIC